MLQIALEGGYIRESDKFVDDYHIFRMPKQSLQQMALSLEGMSHSSQPINLNIGGGGLLFESVTEGFLANVTSSGEVILHLGKRELNKLVTRISHMAACDTDPGEVIKIHLDYSFTEADEGVSDIVIERIEE
jgi:hypothetical protein